MFRVGVLSLFLLCCSAISLLEVNLPPESEAPYKINIGTSESVTDVVVQDLHEMKWNDEQGPASYVMGTDVTTAQFYISHGMQLRDTDTLQLQEPVAVVSPADLSTADGLPDVDLVDWGREASLPVPATGKTLPLKLKIECHTAGTYFIAVNLRLFLTLGDDKSYKGVQFGFKKSCKAGAAPTVGVTPAQPLRAIKGFNVGTKADSTGHFTDVVKDGETSANYLPSRTKSLTTLGDDKDFVRFLMEYTPSEPNAPPFSGARILVEDQGILLVESYGKMSCESAYCVTDLSNSNKPYESDLILKFFCLAKGDVVVSVSIEQEANENSIVAFSFTKSCTSAHHAEGVPYPGLTISDGSKTVVKDGLSQKGYRNPQTDDTAGLADVTKNEVGVDEHTKAYKFTLAQGSKKLRLRRPILFSQRQVNAEEGGYRVVQPTARFSASGPLDASDKNVEATLTVEFHCLRAGSVLVSVEVPFYPRGSFAYTISKKCSTPAQVPEDTPQPTIEGLMITSPSQHGHLVYTKGKIAKDFDWIADESSLELVEADEYFFSLRLANDVPETPLRYLTPELVSNLDIASTTMSGLGSDGAELVKGSPSNIIITFHCLGTGIATYTLALRFVDSETTPLEISFRKECNLAISNQPKGISKLGGISLDGFNIGLTKSGSEIVMNGFPQPAYFGQKHRADPDWDEIRVDGDVNRVTFYVHLEMPPTWQTPDPIQFEKPRVAEHHSYAVPTLSGPAAAGGVLEVDEVMELALDFNCKFEGVAAVTVVVPIIPHGDITFTVPKQCKGEVHPSTVKVPGLKITSMPDEFAKDPVVVVSDGVAVPAFSAQKGRHDPLTLLTEVSFQVQMVGEGVGTIVVQEPIAICHRKNRCQPVISHTLKKADNLDNDLLAIVDSEPKVLTVRYGCLTGGASELTVAIRLQPTGVVLWTFLADCPDTLLDDLEFDVDDYDSLLNDYDYFEKNTDDNYLIESLDRSDNIDPEDPLIADGYDDMIDDYYDIFGDDLYNEEYSDALACIRQNECDTHSINVGTSLLLASNVVRAGQTQVSFTAECAKAKMCTVLPARQSSITLFLAPSTGTVKIDPATITVRAKSGLKKKGEICTPTMSGSLAQGGNIATGLASDLTIDFNCKRPGVASIAVSIRVENSVNPIAFAFAKICGGFKKQEEFTWTASHALTFGILFVLAGGLGLFCWWTKRAQDSRKAYQPVGTRGSLPSTAVDAEKNIEDPASDSD